MSTETRRYRAQVASLTRSRSADDPALVQARQSLVEARLAEQITNALKAQPPLRADQREHLSELLTAGGGAA
jgi:hypothetical protein